MAEATMRLALLGQPNSGKSTLFNGLTGSHQRVGNWPGKTVEKKLGTCTRGGTTYAVCDLPGAYSLSAVSDEEQVTQEYIANGEADVVCVMVDASQLARSLYMLADFAGAQVPCVLALNMIDVARAQGKQINSALLQQRLGIPVVEMSANDPSYYDALTGAIDKAAKDGSCVSVDSLKQLYEQRSPEWAEAYGRLTAAEAAAPAGRFDAVWLAAREAAASEKGAVACATARFLWVDQLIQGVQTTTAEGAPKYFARLDRALMSARWGKLVGVLVCLGALIAGIICGAPLMMLGQIPSLVSEPIAQGLISIGAPDMIVSFFSSTLMTVLYFVLSMAGFVFGIAFVFGILDEAGVVARISYLFDGTMSKLGLPGKVMMPFLSGFACNIGSVTGMRVVDSWGQRVLAIAMCWAVPCGSTMAIIPTLGLTFFGPAGMIGIVLGIAVGIPLVMLLVAKVFGNTLAPVGERAGLVMELPPYHKPRLKPLFFMALRRYKHIAWRAFKVILIVAIAFWLLTYSPTGLIENSVIGSIGLALDPVTQFFGMGWRTFVAFLGSILAKEAMVGVLAAVYASADPSLLAAASGTTASAFSLSSLVTQVSGPEALAFMFAVAFNVPCVMTLGATYSETHSLKWTVIIALFYVAMALVISFVVFHIAGLFMV